MITVRDNFTFEQKNIISSLAERCGILKETATILYARGVDTENKVRRFLAPGRKHFTDPFELKGAREFCERIKEAKERGDKIVIYGDYDADGVCASTIMHFALAEYGLGSDVVLPERTDGYGLSVKLIDKLMERYDPDLIITVDCGISCKDEVEYVKDLGVDIMVTDHHELPDELPDCTIVNCKLKDREDAFDGLCGAGVAFKLATALIGTKAYEYLDLAALATVADSMPLVDENRDIVAEGLRLISSPRARTAFKALIEAAKLRDFSSTAIAFSIAPRINAAGRMGDARSALKLFLSDNRAEIFSLAAHLNELNIARQAECDELYRSAKEKLMADRSKAYKRVIVLEDENWKNGLVGIAAARLAEEFCRPVIMLVNRNGVLHGSCRSIEGINILDAVAHCREYLTEYGGHSQAAGVTLTIDNIEAFTDSLDKYISAAYPPEIFLPRSEVEFYIDGEFPMEFAREIERLEPFGTGNRRPMFALETTATDMRPLKAGSPHLIIDASPVDLLYFGGLGHESVLRVPVKKTYVFETNITLFGGKESLKGYVRSFETEAAPSPELGLELYMRMIRSFRRETTAGGEPAQYITQGRTLELIYRALECPYGTVFVASGLKTVEKFPILKNLPLSVGEPLTRNLSNCVVVSLSGGDLKGFSRIIFLDSPPLPVKRTSYAEVYVNKDIDISATMPRVDCSRAAIIKVFRAIRSMSGERASCSRELYERSKKVPDISRYQFVFAAEVIEELGIIAYESGRLKYNKSVHADLSASRILAAMEKL